MCEYCENEKRIFEKTFDDTSMAFGWSGENSITINDVDEKKMAVIIDRGYLRFINTDDYQCMDASDNVKIKFCPFCGKDLQTQLKEQDYG